MNEEIDGTWRGARPVATVEQIARGIQLYQQRLLLTRQLAELAKEAGVTLGSVQNWGRGRVPKRYQALLNATERP